MAVRHKEPRYDISTAATAGLLLAGLLAGPVIAAPERDLLHEDEPGLDVAADALTVTPVNNSDELLDNHLLKPRAQSAARGAFASEAAAEKGVDQDAEASEAAAPEPGLHSASDRKPSPYKRQMYRRDI